MNKLQYWIELNHVKLFYKTYGLCQFLSLALAAFMESVLT